MAIKHIKCPQCGGIIEADTEKQFAVCQNCGKSLKRKTKDNESSQTTVRKTTAKHNDSFVALKCPSCGADFEYDPSKESGVCQYCGTQIIRNKQIVVHQGSIKIDRSDEIENLLYRAKEMEKDYDYDSAIFYYNKVLDIDPRNQLARSAIKKAEENKKHSYVRYDSARYDSARYDSVHYDSVHNEAYQQDGIIYSSKNKYLAFALAIILGIFGIHNFYLGKAGKGFIQLVLSIISLSASVFSVFLSSIVFFIWVWAIIEGIIIITGSTTDGYGYKLK